jgi:phosphatidylserine/phosphatidylglycerophosphate/cardiolipin synthase-like enzyme
MRHSTAKLAAILILALLLVIRFYPHLKRSLFSSRRSTVPAAAPGAVPVAGPYFSDGDRVAEHIVAAINHTRETIDAAIYDLTQPDITAALEAAHRRGVAIRIVADERQAQQAYSEIPYLRSKGILVRLSRGYKGNRSIMHNKFAVFDGRLAETGSFNWTISAENYNFENAIFVSEPAVVVRFEDEFERIWEQAQRSMSPSKNAP